MNRAGWLTSAKAIHQARTGAIERSVAWSLANIADGHTHAKGNCRLGGWRIVSFGGGPATVTTTPSENRMRSFKESQIHA